MELLETRVLLTSTLFLDFGGGIGMGNTLNETVTNFRNIFGAGNPGGGGSFGTGSDMTNGTTSFPGGLNGGDSLVFSPLAIDFDGDADMDNADITALANAVVPLVRRALEAFDINIVVATATSFADAVNTVNANAGSATGQFDAYVFVTTVTSNGFAMGSNSVGDRFGLFGRAAADDGRAQNGNQQDEAALTFADVILGDVSVPNTSPTFNAELAQRMAYTATHEAFHTFTLRHSTGLLASGDVIRLGSNTRANPFIVTRFDLPHTPAVTQPNNYQFIATDADLGLRDSNSNGRPDLAYSTGTGAHDRIGFTRNSASVVGVTVAPFSNQARTTAAATPLTYPINLNTDTDGEILVDASINSDEVIIDGRISANFRARGGIGFSGVSTENDLLTLQGNGQTGTYTPGATGAGTVNYAGGAQINFSEFETLEATGIAIDVKPLVLSQTTIDENGSVTVSGEFVNIDTLDTHSVTIDWKDGSTTVVNLPAGTRRFSASHQFLDDNPTVTPQDTYQIMVTVADQDGDSGMASANLTVRNLAPVIAGSATDATFADKAKEGEPVNLVANFTDVGTQDTHKAVVDWGDGTAPEMLTVTEANGMGTIAGSHAYVAGGIFTISITLTDDDTGVATSTATAVVTGVGVNGGTLQIVGSAEDDRATVSRSLDGGYVVYTDFVDGSWSFRKFTAAQVNDIEVVLCEGDDVLTLLPLLEVPATIRGDGGNDRIDAQGATQAEVLGGTGHDLIFGTPGDDILDGQAGNDIIHGGRGDDRLFGRVGNDSLYGNAGNDYLSGGAGSDSMYGNAGDDLLSGGSGNDWMFAGWGNDIMYAGTGDDHLFGTIGFNLLIGGTGEDRILGGLGEDLIVSGDTAYLGNFALLSQIRDVWSNGQSYATRTNRIRNGIGTPKLDNTTVVNDGDHDVLAGSTGHDWFFRGAEDLLLDRLPIESIG
ncbi:MAG: hypothetical protein KDA93_04360 [Planctomycetaceae bacterium]|nr:hypothetical protein [Planctomycetaceae bacterium]